MRPNPTGLTPHIQGKTPQRALPTEGGHSVEAPSANRDSPPRTRPCRHPKRRLPTSRTWENPFLWFQQLMVPSLWHFVMAAQVDEHICQLGFFWFFFNHITFMFWVWGNQITEVKCHFHNTLSRVHSITLTSPVILTVTTWMRQCLSGRFSTLKSSFSRWPVQVRCMKKGTQSQYSGKPKETGWGGRRERSSGWQKTCAHGWFMLIYGKNHHNILK